MLSGFKKLGCKKSPLSGSVLVELALVIPVLITLTFAALDYGQIIFVNQEMERILNEGLRFASTNNAITENSSNGSLDENLGCTPRKLSECGSPSENCPEAYYNTINRMINLQTNILKQKVTIREIVIDYDVTSYEAQAEIDQDFCNHEPIESFEEIGLNGLPVCLRTIAGEITYEYIGNSIFFRGSNYKVTSRMPFLGIGTEGSGVLCM